MSLTYFHNIILPMYLSSLIKIITNFSHNSGDTCLVGLKITLRTRNSERLQLHLLFLRAPFLTFGRIGNFSEDPAQSFINEQPDVCLSLVANHSVPQQAETSRINVLLLLSEPSSSI